MTLPIKEKTWQYSVGTNVYDVLAATNNANAIYGMKAAMIGFASNPWTVVGSSNRITAGMDAVDRWTSSASINTANTVGSWIVLKQTGIASNFQILFTCTNTNSAIFQTTMSHSAGFTGGSITANPTATDSVLVTASTQIIRHSEGNAILNVMQTTDGYCTRAFFFVNGFPGQIPWYWCCERLKNPVSGLTRDYFVGNWVDTNQSAYVNSAVRYDYIMTARFHGTHSTSVDQVLSGTSEGIGSSILVNVLQVPNDISGEYQIFPVSLVNTTKTLGQYYGRWGEFYDFWMGSVSNDLYYFKDVNNDTKQFLQLQNVIIPWNGATAIIA